MASIGRRLAALRRSARRSQEEALNREPHLVRIDKATAQVGCSVLAGYLVLTALAVAGVLSPAWAVGGAVGGSVVVFWIMERWERALFRTEIRRLLEKGAYHEAREVAEGLRDRGAGVRAERELIAATEAVAGSDVPPRLLLTHDLDAWWPFAIPVVACAVSIAAGIDAILIAGIAALCLLAAIGISSRILRIRAERRIGELHRLDRSELVAQFSRSVEARWGWNPATGGFVPGFGRRKLRGLFRRSPTVEPPA